MGASVITERSKVRPSADRRYLGPGGSAGAEAEPVDRGEAWTTAARLALLTVAAFLPAIACGWVNWDDDTNFLNNPRFGGLGRETVAWAWTTTLLGVYQPLSWMLLEAECSAWGLNPKGYHVVSLALHAAVAVALFALAVAVLRRCRPDLAAAHPTALHRATGLAVALFAVHPLRAEAVGWVSCQPYLPSLLFALLAVRAYLEAHEPGRSGRSSAAWSALALGLWVVALLFKAVAVSVPAVLLVLDVYPLRRVGPGHWFDARARRAWAGKTAYVALGSAVAAVTLGVRQPNPAGLGERLATAAYSVWFYPVKTLVPVGLSPLYAACDGISLAQPLYLACALGAVGLTAALAGLARRWPGAAAAWACYLAVLAPNSGLVRSNMIPTADRYAYAASTGFVVLLAWAFFRLGCRLRGTPARAAAGGAAAAAVLGLAAASWFQTAAWKSSEMLWGHALTHGAEGSPVAHTNYGHALFERKKYPDALFHYGRALQLRPDRAKHHHNIGLVLGACGQTREAVGCFREAVRLDPKFAPSWKYLGLARSELDELPGAEADLTRALRLTPDDPEAHNFLGLVRLRAGRRAEAAAEFAEALRLRPGDPDAAANLRKARSDLPAAQASY